MLQGLRTVIYPVSDLDKAKAWYSEVLGQQPYFDQPFYVGYTVGGFELGLDPNAERSEPGRGGPIAYWGVPNADDAVQRLRALGAGEHSAVQDVGEGIRVAVVTDPFGNTLGVIENPHFSVANVG